MGVTQLWQILAPVQQHRPLSSLAGQTLAVDLSIWVYETQSVKQMQGVVSKPFLRNLFFRISHLVQLGVKLVFVVEGRAPELKWEAMMKRQQTRFPGRQGKQSQQRQGRRNFNRCLKECCEMLDILGIPYVQSQGEAEAMCALLNAAGLVDGCLTNDGDAFLYGARVVYRNFTMNSKDPHVESYEMSDIENELGIDRDGLVALALLLGCDYVPKGVPGIGYANAIKLMETLRGRNVLKRLKEWKKLPDSDCLDQVELLMRRKAMAVSDFPQEAVIKEFLVSKDKCPSILPSWKRPIINQLQEFALEKLEWPVEYGLEKILPLVTLWDMQDIIHSKHPCTSLHLKPYRIVKTRVRQGVPCYEIQWHKPVSDMTCPDEYYTTIEEPDLFCQCYQHTVDDFNAAVEIKKAKKPSKGSRKKKKEAEEHSNGSHELIQNKVPSQSDTYISEELSAGFADLKVEDTGQLHNGNKFLNDELRKSLKVPKCSKLKHPNNKRSGKITENSDRHRVPLMTDALEHNTNALNSVETRVYKKDKVKKKQESESCIYGVQTEDTLSPMKPICSEDSMETVTLNESKNDSFIPLTLRVKKNLRKKKACVSSGPVNVINSSVSRNDELVPAVSKCMTSASIYLENNVIHDVQEENKNMEQDMKDNNIQSEENKISDHSGSVNVSTCSDSHQAMKTRSLNDSLGFNIPTDCDDTGFSVDYFSEMQGQESGHVKVSEVLNIVGELKNESTTTENNDKIHACSNSRNDNLALASRAEQMQTGLSRFDAVKHQDFHSIATCSPEVRIKTAVTPLSLQKEFISDRFSTQISSPFREEFCSPVMYIKQNVEDTGGINQSFIEIEDSPLLRKPDNLITNDLTNDTGSILGDRIVAAIDFNKCGMKTDENELCESGRIFEASGTDCSFQLFDTKYTNKIKEVQQLKTANSYLVPTPLYSAKRHGGNQAYLSPFQFAYRNKLEISQASLLDYPNFEVQTSLLNSLCCTLDQTSTPYNSAKFQDVIIGDRTDTSVQNINISHDNIVMGNICIDNKEDPEYHLNQSLLGDTNVPVCKDYNNLITSENPGIENCITQADSNVAFNYEMSSETKNLMLNIKDVENQCSCHSVPCKCLSKKGDIVINPCNKELGKTSFASDSDTEKESLQGHKERTKNFRKSKIKQNYASSATQQKPKLGKNKVNRKTKNKGIKKVSAVMDLSHDDEEDIILSQAVLSQKNVFVENKTLSYKPLEDVCVTDVNDKENISTRLDERDCSLDKHKILNEICSKLSSVMNKYKLNDDKNCTSRMKANFVVETDSVKRMAETDLRNSLKLNSYGLVSEPATMITNAEINQANPKSEERSPLSKNSNAYTAKVNFIGTKGDTLTKRMPIALETNTPSPVSLADRLKKKLKNSSTQKVLADFTKL